MAGLTLTLICCAQALILGVSDAASIGYQGTASAEQYQGNAQESGSVSVKQQNTFINSILQSMNQLSATLQYPLDTEKIQHLLTENPEMTEKLFNLPEDVRDTFYGMMMLMAATDPKTGASEDIDILENPIFKDVLKKDSPVYEKLAESEELKSDVQELMGFNFHVRQTMENYPAQIQLIIARAMPAMIEQARVISEI